LIGVTSNFLKSSKKFLKMLQIDEVGTVGERILQLVDHFHQGNKTAFGRAANIQSGVLAGIVGGRESKPGFEILQKLLTAYPTVSPNWLLFGRGEMLIPATNNNYTERVDPFASTSTPDGVEKRSFFPPGYIEEFTRREKEQRDKAYEEYYAALQQQEQTRNAVKALIEHLAAKDPTIRGLMDLLPSAFEDILDPDTKRQMEDAEWERRNDEYNADQEAEWARQRQEREQQKGQE
jgi:hypothetical protein